MTKGVSKHLVHPGATPYDVFQVACEASPYALWLDHHGERGRGVSYLAEAAALTLTEKWRQELREAWRGHALPDGEGVDGVPLGVFFVMPYELGVETVGVSHQGDTVPRALVVTKLLEVAHGSGEVTAYWLDSEGKPEEWLETIQKGLKAQAPAEDPVLPVMDSPSWRDSTGRYREMISRAHSYIARGDAYQLCVTTQLALEGHVDPVALHRVMRESNPTHHQALIRFPDLTMVSASPETFLTLSAKGEVSTRPIKGTRPRGLDAFEDASLREELVASDKERAENLMIVDLMRNDLSRVCETGSVRVPELLVVESYATVHQLVSTITGDLLPGLDLVDVLDAAFPAGSMTGAPKKRAIEILQELEGHPRGLYSGTYGVWRVDGSSECAMTIRTALISENSISLGVGGGITALSDPAEEIREVGIKAQAFLRALGVEQVGYS